MNEFTDKEVAAAMKFYGEHGCYPRNVKPQVIKMAEKLKAAAREIMESI
jgi:hypothetical protein